ncbi:MAG: succinate dehydrogenase [Cyclobacteriaceae bacterium]|nr:MAG: succinate dehydrogenase [Cyclobacteriaceae bacterium]
MSWLTDALKSSLGRKLVMALTGLFLVLFLVGHVLGNLLLFVDDGGQAFNEYARFMSTTPAIQVLSLLTYVSIIVHVFYSILLSRHNRQTRPVPYAVNDASANSLWPSRNMGILGTIVLIFLVIHLKSFWYEMKFGEIPMVNYDGVGEFKDLYSIVAEAFTQWWYVAIYVVAMFGLAFHLSHGFKSAFQTLGLSHKKYTPLIEAVGLWFAIIVPALFALIPLVMFIQSLA